MKTVEIGDARTGPVRLGPGQPLGWVAGPCVIEDRSVMANAAERLKKLSERLGVPVVFKSSYEKDNRTTELSYQGPGLDKGLRMLEWIRREFALPVLSDVHRVGDLAAAGEVLDVIQIPAFLCQQTSLLEAAGRTGKPIHVKKGQFMAPGGMRGAVTKILATGNDRILLCERGNMFGYNNMVNDFTAIPQMQTFGCPVVYDATHSVRRYGIPSADPKGGNPHFIPTLVRCGVAAGCDALFMETHPDPPRARCDASSQYRLDGMEELLAQAKSISEIVRG